jgi:hypothetical protein
MQLAPKSRQAELLALNGGRDAVIARGDLGFSPPPGIAADFNRAPGRLLPGKGCANCDARGDSGAWQRPRRNLGPDPLGGRRQERSRR